MILEQIYNKIGQIAIMILSFVIQILEGIEPMLASIGTGIGLWIYWGIKSKFSKQKQTNKDERRDTDKND